jgi:ABC-type transport system involved in cytochrome c biogenesis permease subunit
VWLFIHIGFGKVFLGATLVAVGLAGVILSRGTQRGDQWFQRLPASERLDDLAYRCMALGFIFESLMLVAGAIWAQDAWGRYWAWDPLETWAFLTWLALGIALHARVTYRLSPRVGAVLVLAVFAVAFLTFFGVPFVSTSAHKGAV